MNVQLEKEFLLLSNENEQSDILYHIDSSAFYRIYKEPLKSQFRGHFLYNVPSLSVKKELEKVSKENSNCSKGCQSCVAANIDNPKEFAIRKLALVLTSKCNLQCKYCYANYGMYDYKKESTMTKEVLLSGLRYLTENFKEIKTIQFFGGEPSLCVDLIKSTIYFFKKMVEDGNAKNEPVYGIVTNGVYMPEELIKLFKENKFRITISLDGPEGINNLLRIDAAGKGKFVTIRNNYLRLLAEGVEDVGFECTYTAEHIRNSISLVDIVKFFDQEFNCPVPHIVPVNIDELSELNIFNEWERYEAYIDEAIAYAFDNMINEHKISSVGIFLGIIGRIITHLGDQRICPAGVQTFSLSHDECISPCFMYTSNEDISYGKIGDDPKMILKNAYDFDEKINNKEISEDCLNCSAKAVCSSCLGSFDISNSEVSVSNQATCETIRYAMTSILKKIVDIKSDADKWKDLCNFMENKYYGKKET